MGPNLIPVVLACMVACWYIGWVACAIGGIVCFVSWPIFLVMSIGAPVLVAGGACKSRSLLWICAMMALALVQCCGRYRTRYPSLVAMGLMAWNNGCANLLSCWGGRESARSVSYHWFLLLLLLVTLLESGLSPYSSKSGFEGLGSEQPCCKLQGLLLPSVWVLAAFYSRGEVLHFGWIGVFNTLAMGEWDTVFYFHVNCFGSWFSADGMCWSTVVNGAEAKCHIDPSVLFEQLTKGEKVILWCQK